MTNRATKTKWMGPNENTQEYFSAIRDEGMAYLADLRTEVKEARGDGEHLFVRTWGAIQAAAMIGRSPQWLRDNDPDVPRNEAGHGRWTLERILELKERAGELYKRPPGSNRALIVAMSKFKGGVGNSTNTMHIAHGLAMKGLKVLIWDWDAQATTTTGAGGVVPDSELVDEDLPLYAMLHDPSSIIDDASTVVRGTYFHNVDLIPANSALNELEMSLITQHLRGVPDTVSGIPPEHRMSAVLSHISEYYDVILIDCPPALGMNTMNALLAADAIITSIKPELYDRASLVAYTDALAGMFAAYDVELKYFRILISQFQDGISASPQQGKGSRASGHLAGEFALRKLYGPAVLENMMHHSREIGNASAQLSTVLANDKPVGSRTTYNRAVSVVNAVVNELYEDFLAIWEMERDDE